MTDRREYCRYCFDAHPRPSWTLIGGTIGESHYICHRKLCQRAHKAVEVRRKASLAAYRAHKAAWKAGKARNP